MAWERERERGGERERKPGRPSRVSVEPQSTRPDSATWEEDDRSNRRRPLTGKLAASPKALAFQQGKKVGVSTEAEHEINKTVASKPFSGNRWRQ